MKFKWEGFTAGGQVRTGEEEAESREIAVGNLKLKGFYVQKIVDASEPLNPVLPQPEAPREIVPLDIPGKKLPPEYDLEEARRENAKIAAGEYDSQLGIGVKASAVPAPCAGGLDDVFGSAVSADVKTPCPDKTPCEGEGCRVTPQPREFTDWQVEVNATVNGYIDLCNYMATCMPGESFDSMWEKMSPALYSRLVNKVLDMKGQVKSEPKTRKAKKK